MSFHIYPGDLDVSPANTIYVLESPSKSGPGAKIGLTRHSRRVADRLRHAQQINRHAAVPLIYDQIVGTAAIVERLAINFLVDVLLSEGRRVFHPELSGEFFLCHPKKAFSVLSLANDLWNSLPTPHNELHFYCLVCWPTAVLFNRKHPYMQRALPTDTSQFILDFVDQL